MHIYIYIRRRKPLSFVTHTTQAPTNIHTYVYVCIYICVCVCVCTYIHTTPIYIYTYNGSLMHIEYQCIYRLMHIKRLIHTKRHYTDIHAYIYVCVYSFHFFSIFFVQMLTAEYLKSSHTKLKASLIIFFNFAEATSGCQSQGRNGSQSLR